MARIARRRVMRLLIFFKISSFPDSMPSATMVKPASLMARNVASSAVLTCVRQVRLSFILRFRISSQKATTRCLQKAKVSSMTRKLVNP